MAKGYIAAPFEEIDDIESTTEAAFGNPLLEVFSPILQRWSGEIIGVADYYEDATVLRNEILLTNRTSWLVAAGTFLASGLLLFAIV